MSSALLPAEFSPAEESTLSLFLAEFQFESRFFGVQKQTHRISYPPLWLRVYLSNAVSVPGQDEVIAVSEKVIVKLEDLVKWTVWDSSCWKKGLHALPLKPSMLKELGKNGQRESLYRYRESTLNSGLNFKDVLREKAELGMSFFETCFYAGRVNWLIVC